MDFTHPTDDEIKEMAHRLYIEPSQECLDDYLSVIEKTLEVADYISDIDEPTSHPLKIDTRERSGSWEPEENTDPYNAWITRCEIKRTSDGALADKTVGLKDSISLAGVEMTCGSQLLNDYVPTVDATVVDRLLESGATIVGKTNMENFAFSSSSDTSDYGDVLNPHDPDRIAGGSSSGSAAAVAAGDVDIALGCDQGASIRVPAACCGVVGLDPTDGLVPYTGVFPMDPTLDHVGPIAGTVTEIAETLEVIAGWDRLDPHQPVNIEADDYTKSLNSDIEDIEIGILKEGFEVEDINPQIAEIVRNAITDMSALGAETTEVSLPLHFESISHAFLIWAYGALQIFKQGGQGTLLEGWYDTHLMDEFDKVRRERVEDLPINVKATLVAMEYLQESGGTKVYGKAQNFRYFIRKQIDSLLSTVDVLMLPTVPILPYELPDETDVLNQISDSLGLSRNTATTSLTGHPSISVPCGTVNGLPVGLMLVGDRFDERTLIQVSHTYERHIHSINSSISNNIKYK